jgi:hypothetical protein
MEFTTQHECGDAVAQFVQGHVKKTGNQSCQRKKRPIGKRR